MPEAPSPWGGAVAGEGCDASASWLRVSRRSWRVDGGRLAALRRADAAWPLAAAAVKAVDVVGVGVGVGVIVAVSAMARKLCVRGVDVLMAPAIRRLQSRSGGESPNPGPPLQHPIARRPVASGDGPVAAFGEACAGDGGGGDGEGEVSGFCSGQAGGGGGDGGADAGLDRGFVGGAGGGGGHQVIGECGGVVDVDRF